MRKEEKQFRQYLKTRNLKNTPERMAVLKEALSSDGHFDADQLLEKVKKYNKRVSRATIYRVLPLLVESGFVTETLSSGGRVSYERMYGSDIHNHMICDECDEVLEFRSTGLDEVVMSVCESRGFTQREHRLIIRGLCQKCSKNDKEAL